MGKVKLILVGGFLGAGKTTLMAKAAACLIKQGKKVGIVTNDQAVNLVDTNILQQQGLGVQEVAGGCFCCRFNDFIAASSRVINTYNPDVMLGEPVGSCTDLSATVLQPLKKLYTDQFELAPYSVLVDPGRLVESLDAKAGSLLPECALYIYRKQLEEADLIVLNKIDTISAKQLTEIADLINQEFPMIPVMTISALRGDNVREWLDSVMSGKGGTGKRLAEVDYDTYAQGEAVLGWLNASFQLHSSGQTDWESFCNLYLSAIQTEMESKQAEIVHVKLFLKGASTFLVANLVGNKAAIFVDGNLKDSSKDVDLIVNMRVRMEPADLRSIAERCLNTACGDKIRIKPIDIKSFKPGYPRPTHRFNSVVV